MQIKEIFDLKILIFCILCIQSTSLFGQQVNILVVAIKGVQQGQKEWQPTIDYLSDSLPEYQFSLFPITPKQLEQNKSVLTDLDIDFVISQPALYVDLELNHGISKILTMVGQSGHSEFGSAIIVHADSEIKSIGDLDGKTISGVAKLGFGGWLIGLKEMLDNGFDPYLSAKEILFLGTQPKQVNAILNGQVDAAVVRTGMIEKLSEQNKIDINKIRILSQKNHPDFPFKSSTPLYPEWAFARTHKASNQLSKKVGLAMLSIKPDSHEALSAGYMEWTFPYDYQPVHDILKILRVGPYRNYGKLSIRMVLQKYWPSIIIMIAMTVTIFLLILNSHRKAKKLARLDSLTGINNRRAFFEKASMIHEESIRYDHVYSIIMLDIDHFKKINDKYGHPTGDKVLIEVVKIIKKTIRMVDIAARMGGEEFIIVLPQTRIEKAEKLAERLRVAFSEYALKTDDHLVGFTASFGVAESKGKNYSLEQIIQQADSVLYQAKQQGRNCVVLTNNSRPSVMGN